MEVRTDTIVSYGLPYLRGITITSILESTRFLEGTFRC